MISGVPAPFAAEVPFVAMMNGTGFNNVRGNRDQLGNKAFDQGGRVLQHAFVTIYMGLRFTPSLCLAVIICHPGQSLLSALDLLWPFSAIDKFFHLAYPPPS